MSVGYFCLVCILGTVAFTKRQNSYRRHSLQLYAYTISGIGYDAGGGDRASCGRPYRAGRIYQPPCDLERFGYCAHAGQLYPWKAVKRFVKDNQGLMRRMYGDQRHGHVLKAELDDIEDLDMNENEHWRPTSVRFAKYLHDDDNYLEASMEYSDDINEEESRYLKDDLTNDDVLNTKFVISEQEAAVAIKLAELKAAAHFRNACPVKEEVVAPFWANNTRGEVLALLNMYPFEQYVHWEKCTFEHRQMYCREGCRCEQQYRLHRLLAYDPNNECRGIFSDWFRFPSCCVCKCYDMPPEFRVTSRSPRYQKSYSNDEDEEVA
ncbi:hypothetical protein ABEB36_008412 [Hypothenemus hampei]|uniref:Spaetzle domain-containing protein n=1 Tax=Hypothenemus hampei TaxID=57062 RepID=A0ABD1ELQ5_HYPHA